LNNNKLTEALRRVRHDRKTKYVHGEDPSEHFEPIPNPLFAMRVVSPCDVIVAAQIRPANTAIHGETPEFHRLQRSHPDSPVA